MVSNGEIQGSLHTSLQAPQQVLPLNLPPSFKGSYNIRGRYATIIDDSQRDSNREGWERQREEKQMQMESNKEDGRAPFSALISSVNIGTDIIYCTFRVYPVYLSIPVGTVSQGLHTSTLGSTISAPITNPTLMSDSTECYPYAM